MNTPPGQTVTRPRTPSTPRHSTRFDLESPTRKQPSRAKKQISTSSNYSVSTLSPPPSSPIEATSPRRSPRHQKKARFALEDDNITDDEERTESRQTLFNVGGFGLATPAKTPRKKKLPQADIAGSARQLFSSSKSTSTATTTATTTTKTVHSSSDLGLPPRTPIRKNVKRDLFGSIARTPRRKLSSTLEVDPEVEENIQIFTDSDARRPTKDQAPENPFNTRSTPRKKRAPKPLDDDEHKDGMYYVFRGKKIFKRFDNLPDNEERAGPDDEGLTPASIKPRLLFGTRASRRLEAENIPADQIADPTVAEEEAETDIDEASQPQSSSVVISNKNTPKKAVASRAKRNVSRMTPESDDDDIIPKSSVFATPSSSKKRSAVKPGMSASRALFDEGEDGDFLLPARKLLFDDDEDLHSAPAPAPASKGKKRALDIGLDTPIRTPRRKRTHY